MKLVKMHGIGNDYVFADCIEEQIQNPEELAVKISDRHYGVGSDGLILILPSDQADYQMQVYNADGTYAQMCGNGIRCVGKYLYDHGYVRKETISIESGGSVKQLNLMIQDGVCTGARVNMGKPDIPGYPGLRSPYLRLYLGGYEHMLTLVSMGNPHAVEFLSEIEDIEIETVGPLIENHNTFPDRTNVEFVRIVDDRTLQMRVWERGSGETFACGTGATAAAVAAILNDYCTSNEITVQLKGGDLKISWNGIGEDAFMEGPASYVFEIKDLQL